MKIAIVVDSSCGLRKEIVEKSNWYFLPLFINIDSKEYVDGVSIDSNNLTQYYNNSSIVSTAATPIGMVEELFSRLERNYDAILVYPISTHLSSQCQNLTVIAKKYSKVFVIESIAVTTQIIDDILKMEADIKNDEMTYKQAIKFAESPVRKEASEIYLIPKTNEALLNGGRLTPAAAKIANLLKIVPIISFRNGKLEKYGKGRTFLRTCLKTIDAVVKAREKKIDKTKRNSIIFLHTECSDIDTIISETQKKFPEWEIKIYNIPSVIAIHTGLESFAFYIQEDSDKLITYLEKLKN